MRSLARHRSIWEGHSKTDPLWAIITDPRYQGGKWKPSAFFKTGDREIAIVFGRLKKLKIKLQLNGRALDFGCGVGRLTQALAKRFSSALGLDISTTMIEQARKFNRMGERLQFGVNASWNLASFSDASFNFIYASIVLQHIPPPATEGYLREFLRVLKPGGILVFNLPSETRVGWFKLFRYRLRLRTRIKQLMQSLGLAHFPGFDPHPIDMFSVPEGQVRQILNEAHGKILDCVTTNTTDDSFYKGIQFLKAPLPGIAYPTLMYTVQRHAGPKIKKAQGRAARLR